MNGYKKFNKNMFFVEKLNRNSFKMYFNKEDFFGNYSAFSYANLESIHDLLGNINVLPILLLPWGGLNNKDCKHRLIAVDILFPLLWFLITNGILISISVDILLPLLWFLITNGILRSIEEEYKKVLLLLL